MQTDMDTNECKYNHLGPCSLTHLFLRERTHPKAYWIDAYKSEFSTLIFEYKAAFQKLQLTLLEEELDSSAEIGHYFQKLEEKFENLIANYRKD